MLTELAEINYSFNMLEMEYFPSTCYQHVSSERWDKQRLLARCLQCCHFIL
jgi:hypothetical protein